jgi:hypothetical protein
MGVRRRKRQNREPARQPGVDRVLEILQAGLKLTMGNCGTRIAAEITRAYVATPDWKI